MSPPRLTTSTTAAIQDTPDQVADEVPGEDTSPGRYKETPDAGNYFLVPSGSGEGLATSQFDGPERIRFSVYVGGDDVAGNLRAQLTNVSGRDIRFTDGLRVVAEVTRNGQPWREFVLVDPAVSALALGQEASVQTSFLLEGPAQYSGWGSIEIELV